MQNLAEWDVLVGRVSGTWDRALLKIQPYSQALQHFEEGREFVATKPSLRQLKILSSRRSGHSFILDVGLKTTAEAQALVGQELFVHPSMRPPLSDDEYYIDEVLGFRVVTDTGEDFGEIDEIIETPAHDVYVTACSMIPAVPEYVLEIDFDTQIVKVRYVPGLRTDEGKKTASKAKAATDSPTEGEDAGG
ncbi:MAG TPA: ribosome maturation factor RimM [Abditibacteriaceae bacterium]|jgi:16S rRNA processing protein RimM